MTARTVHLMVEGKLAKHCSRCKQLKHLDQYSPAATSYLGRQSACRACEAAAERRRRKTQPHIAVAEAARRELRRQDNQRRVKQYLATHPCVDCGETDPIVLEFDHVRGVKRRPISQMTQSSSWRSIEAEIAKCEVRCANCHRRKTARQLGWWTYMEDMA